MATPPTVTLPADLIHELTHTLHEIKRVFEPRRRRDGHHAQFGGPWWQQPQGVYVDNDDSIRVNVRNMSNLHGVTLTARIITDDGRVQTNSVAIPTPSYFAVLNTGVMPCWEGLLVGVTASITDAGVQSRNCYITAYLVRNAGPNETINLPLISGWVTGNNKALGWPSAGGDPGGGEPGYRFTTALGAQTAGADILYGVGANTAYRPTMINATLTTGVTVANRMVALKITDGTNTLWQIPSRVSGASAQQASTTWLYQWGAVLGYEETVGYPLGTATELGTSIPDVLLLPNYTIGTVTTGLQATDQWMSFVMSAEGFIAS